MALRDFASYRQHRSAVNPTPRSVKAGMAFQCTRCPAEFGSSFSLGLHQGGCRKSSSSPPKAALDKSPSKMLSTVDGNKIYKCPFISCPKGFPAQNRLLDHFSSKHRKKASIHVCSTCPRAFLLEAVDLHQHTATDHAKSPSAKAPLASNKAKAAAMGKTVHTVSAATAGQSPLAVPVTQCKAHVDEHSVQLRLRPLCKFCHDYSRWDIDDNGLPRSLDEHMARQHRCTSCCKDFRTVSIVTSAHDSTYDQLYQSGVQRSNTPQHLSLLCRTCLSIFAPSACVNMRHRFGHQGHVEAGCISCRSAALTGQACYWHPSDERTSAEGSSVQKHGAAVHCQESNTTIAPYTAPADQLTSGTHELADADMSDSAPLLLPPAEEPSRDPSSELSAPESSGEDGPQCEVGTEARATEAEVALATAHTPGPCDRECASASEVSDCVGSWTEVSSVCSEDLAAFEVAIAAADQGQRIDEGDRAMVDDCRVGGAPELEQTSRDGAADTGMAEKSHEPGSAETEGRGEGQVEGADAVPASETPTDIALNAATKQISGVQAASAAPSSIQSPAAGQTVLTCKACTKAPTSPIVTMCGHVFCHRCILNALTSTLSCPTCDRPIFVKLDL